MTKAGQTVTSLPRLSLKLLRKVPRYEFRIAGLPRPLPWFGMSHRDINYSCHS